MATNGCESVEVPEVVDKAFKQVAAEQGFKKPCFDVTSGSGMRDGYLSTMYRAHIRDEDPSGPQDMSAMCKMSMDVMHSIMKSVFTAEGHIYSKVLPAMASEAGPEATPLWPRVLYVSTESQPPHCLVLEDFKPLGFGPPDRSKTLDVHHCRLLVEQLAKFHAAGFLLRHNKPDAFKDLVKPLTNLFDTDDMRTTFEPFLKDIQTIPDLLTERWPEGSKVYRVVRKACDASAVDFSVMVEPRTWPNDAEGCCLAHGDCQINNIAFKYDKATGKVTGCMLYDFQIVHLSSPTVDLVRSLLISTDQELRRAHLDDLLRDYLHQLHAHLRAGGVDQPETVFSWDTLQRHMQRTAIWGLLMHPLFHNLMHSDDETIAKVRETMHKAGDGEAGNGEVGKAAFVQYLPDTAKAFRELVEDMEARGWLPAEEDIDKWLAGEA